MEAFLDWFNHWNLLNPILTVLTIVALICSYIFYRRSIKDKKLVYGFVTHRIVSKFTSEKLKVTYSGKEVPSLSESTFFIWNKGKQHIEGSDNDTIDKIRLQVEGQDVNIYDITLAKQSRNANNFSVKEDVLNKSYYINFDYINHKDGAAFHIIHTGLTSRDLKIVGTVKGSKKEIIRYSLFRNDSVMLIPDSLSRKLKPSNKYKLNLMVFFLFPVYLIFGLGFQFYKDITAGNVSAIIALIFLTFISFFPIFLFVKRIPPTSICDF